MMKLARAADPLVLPARPEMLALPAARQLALPAGRVRRALPAPVEALPLTVPALPEHELVPVPVHDRDEQRHRRAA